MGLARTSERDSELPERQDGSGPGLGRLLTAAEDESPALAENARSKPRPVHDDGASDQITDDGPVLLERAEVCTQRCHRPVANVTLKLKR